MLKTAYFDLGRNAFDEERSGMFPLAEQRVFETILRGFDLLNHFVHVMFENTEIDRCQRVGLKDRDQPLNLSGPTNQLTFNAI